MKTNSRRRFIRNTSLTASGILLTTVTKAKKDSIIASTVGCAPNKVLSLSGTIASKKSGKWSDPDTWGGRLPSAADTPLITPGHVVVMDMDTTISGINIENTATLKFDPAKSAKVQSTKNVVVRGLLEMTPSSLSVTHYFQFIGIDESLVVGRSHTVLDTDIGLWVVDSGKVNLVGTEKKSWTNLAGSANAGASSITLKETPLNWAVGDEIVVCPTQSIAELGRQKTEPLFERFEIKSISGNTVTLNGTLSYNHLKVEPAGSGKQWTAEVLNLKRNVRVEGTQTGKSHFFVKSTSPQVIKNVALRYMGPKTENIGRYALHFHHCMNGSIGTVVQNCVAFDTGSHCFVPHTSHGITFTNCVAFNFVQEAYWWDEGDITHGVTYDGCVAALGSGVGFLMGIGDDNRCVNSVSVSSAIGRAGGTPNTSGGFFWEANNEGVWEFKNNLSHSDYNGLRVWQNTQKIHLIENYCTYNNMLATFHGAYMNNYIYKFGYHYNSVLLGKATSSQTSGVRFEHITFDAAGQDYGMIYSDSPIESWDNNTNKFYYCTFKNFTVAPILFEASKPSESDGTASVARTTKKYDIIYCDLGGKLPAIHPDVENGTVIRIQPKTGQSIKIEKVGGYDLSDGKIVTSNIAAFAATIWGKGEGLVGEYFNGTVEFNDANKVFNRIDPLIAFSEWSTLMDGSADMFHHKLNSESYCVRWSGKLLAQYTEEYTFRCNTAGGTRLYVNGELLIDQWEKEPFNAKDRFALISLPIKLTAGQYYDIRLEHRNAGGYRGCLLHWKSTSMVEYELIPQSQLYPGNAVVTPPVVEEKPNSVPVAKAGEDLTITLPTSTVKLDGQLSSDADGKVVSYNWTKLSGPSQFSIGSATSAVTAVNNLAEGEYIFKLEVKDDKGAVATDDVKITVKPAAEAENKGPVANAGSDKTIQLPNNSVSLDGSTSSDSDGKLVSYKWSKVSGPSQFTISNATAATTTINNLAEGTYVFQLIVTDDKNATATDTVTITVNAATVNKPPVAIAGDKIEISLPTNTTKLNGFASSDADGYISSYKWTKKSGPSQYTIASATAVSTAISNLAEGEYVFELEVEDDKGAVATDQVAVKVNKKQEEVVAPKVNAGEDIAINLPTNNVRLRGSATVDTNSAIKSYQWVKLSGPSRFKIVNANSAQTVINQLEAGNYVFQLEVTDTNGLTGKDEIAVTVLAKDSGKNNGASGSKETENLNVSVTPNPSTSIFNVHVNSNSDKPITLRLFDRWGKEVGEIKNVRSGTSVTIPGNLKRGTYFGVAEQGFQKKTLTLIKM